jgi:hypothetical protein
MCLQVGYSELFIQRISAKAGTSVLHREAAPVDAVSPLIRLEAARYSLATQRGCSFRPIAVRPGFLSMKDFRNAPYPSLKLHAQIVIICLPGPPGRVSGESFLNRRPHPRRRQPRLPHPRRRRHPLQRRLPHHDLHRDPARLRGLALPRGVET